VHHLHFIRHSTNTSTTTVPYRGQGLYTRPFQQSNLLLLHGRSSSPQCIKAITPPIAVGCGTMDPVGKVGQQVSPLFLLTAERRWARSVNLILAEQIRSNFGRPIKKPISVDGGSGTGTIIISPNLRSEVPLNR
jgi:hypothetical protein